MNHRLAAAAVAGMTVAALLGPLPAHAAPPPVTLVLKGSSGNACRSGTVTSLHGSKPDGTEDPQSLLLIYDEAAVETTDPDHRPLKTCLVNIAAQHMAGHKIAMATAAVFGEYSFAPTGRGAIETKLNWAFDDINLGVGEWAATHGGGTQVEENALSARVKLQTGVYSPCGTDPKLNVLSVLSALTDVPGNRAFVRLGGNKVTLEIKADVQPC